MEHGASGRIWTRAEVLDDLAADPTQPGRAVECHAAWLAPDVVLLTYELEGPRPSHRASVWMRTPSGWQLRFHQGTLTGS